MSGNEDLAIGQLIASPITQYKVQKYLGNGTYGMVTQCRNMGTRQTVALKLFKGQKAVNLGKTEEAMLTTMRKRNSDRFNIVRFYDSFTFRGYYCLEFEKLDMELYKFMRMNPGQHLQLKQIRPILQQLATSLDFLKSAGIVHGDLKPENIMMVDHVRQPLKVKVIDFGLSCNNPHNQTGQTLQTLWYRSPEILMKNPFNEAIDTWSLGCIAAELFMGRPLFKADDELDLITKIIHTFGKGAGSGDNRPHWFWPKHWMEWRFMTTRYGAVFGIDDHAEYYDLAWFINLLLKMLWLNSSERITPKGILKHPFITLSRLKCPFKDSLYVKSSLDLMTSVQNQSSGNGGAEAQMIRRASLNRNYPNLTAKAPQSQRHREQDPILNGKILRSLKKEQSVRAITDSENGPSSTKQYQFLQRRKIIFKKEDSIIVISDSEDVPSSLDNSVKKRKSDETEGSVSDKPCPKKRRTNVCGHEASCSKGVM